ncbi:MAG: hypothetical protein CMK64_10340 [Pseudoalteromonas sp.]|nr:hypothetical protein [Pseudoalteromonas sp.]|tara:strand:+ start:7669 stop:8517 length:849 start_codon:yes stop_codon:yes gene_type:complete
MSARGEWGLKGVWEESSVNQPPTVNAGDNVTLTNGSSFSPNASASGYDSLLWTCTSGQNPTFSDNAVLTPSITVNETGVHTFRLTATNSDGQSYDEFTATVSELTNQPPVANAGPDQSVAAGVLVQVSASASIDGDGTIVGYKWRETTNSGITLSSTTAENISFTSPVSDTAQTVTLELIVTDDDGVDSAPVYVDFNVAAEVVAPTLETLSIEIKGSGTGSHEVTVFLASDISTPIYSGLATFVNDRMVVESSDFSSGQQVVGLWLGNNYPATGGAFYGVVS